MQNSAFGIDLGTGNIKIYNNTDGTILNQKNMIAVMNKTTLFAYGDEAFAGCSALTSIYNYRERPAKLGKDVFANVDVFECTLYVNAGSVDMYKASDSDWKDFSIRPLGAASVSTEEVEVTPTETTADVVWPAVTDAVTYELVIKDKNGNVICTLVFDADGRLTSIAFNAPARDNASQQTEAAGFSFTVTGLEQGTTYNYTLTAKDSGGNAIDTKTGTFKTLGGTAVEETSASDASVRKVMRDGVMYMVMPDGRMYDLQGKEVR